MGYYTYFELSYTGVTDTKKLESDFLEITKYQLSYLKEDTLKWYDWESDMSELSLRHPSAIFYLSGDGEDSGDNWRAEIYRGKVRQAHAELVYPDIVWPPDEDPRIHSPELFV